MRKPQRHIGSLIRASSQQLLRLLSWAGAIALVLVFTACVGSSQSARSEAVDNNNPLSGVTILIIRHAEKPVDGRGLSAEGQARARAYVKYFQKLRLDSQSLRPDYLVAADDSEHSHRSRLTLEPLADALGLKPDLRFQARRPQDLAEELRAKPHGKTILICWHHKEIPLLLQALGADPERLLPHGEWPGQEFGWMLRLKYDRDGRLLAQESKRVKEHLMPGD